MNQLFCKAHPTQPLPVPLRNRNWKARQRSCVSFLYSCACVRCLVAGWLCPAGPLANGTSSWYTSFRPHRLHHMAIDFFFFLSRCFPSRLSVPMLTRLVLSVMYINLFYVKPNFLLFFSFHISLLHCMFAYSQLHFTTLPRIVTESW